MVRLRGGTGERRPPFRSEDDQRAPHAVCETALAGPHCRGLRKPAAEHARSTMSTSQAWFKSTYSSGSSGDCVEFAATPDAVHVRDSKDPEGPHLTFAPDAWARFLAFAAQL